MDATMIIVMYVSWYIFNKALDLAEHLWVNHTHDHEEEAAAHKAIDVEPDPVSDIKKKYNYYNYLRVLPSRMMFYMFAVFSGILVFMQNQIMTISENSLIIFLLIHTVLYLYEAIAGFGPAVYDEFFVRKELFKRSTTDFKTFLKDILKGILVFFLALPFIAGITAVLIFYTEYWYVWYALFVLVAMQILPGLMSMADKLYNNYEELEDGPLKDKVIQLAKDANFAVDRIFVEDTSKRSNALNASCLSTPFHKKIVINDNLMERGDEVVLSVLAHELGHHVHKHSIKTMLINTPIVLVSDILIIYLFVKSDISVDLYNAFGLDGTNEGVKYALQPFLFGWVFGWLKMPYRYLMAKWSQKHEYEADAYAVDHGGGYEAFHKSDVDLVKYNKESPYEHWWEALWSTHPPVLDRLNFQRRRLGMKEITLPK